MVRREEHVGTQLSFDNLAVLRFSRLNFYKPNAVLLGLRLMDDRLANT